MFLATGFASPSTALIGEVLELNIYVAWLCLTNKHIEKTSELMKVMKNLCVTHSMDIRTHGRTDRREV